MIIFEANTKGYWCYDNIIIKLDDIVDCLKYLYPQYKCTTIQYFMCGRTSVSPTRQIFLCPKTQDYGLIISALLVRKIHVLNEFI